MKVQQLFRLPSLSSDGRYSLVCVDTVEQPAIPFPALPEVFWVVDSCTRRWSTSSLYSAEEATAICGLTLLTISQMQQTSHVVVFNEVGDVAAKNFAKSARTGGAVKESGKRAAGSRVPQPGIERTPFSKHE